MRNNNKLQITFYTPISGNNWSNINNLFTNVYKKPLQCLIIKMNDTLYKTIQLTNSLNKEEETFLKGIITGYNRQEASYIIIDKYGIEYITE